MRAFDCVHEDHEDMHFTGSTDQELTQRIREHRDQYHPEINDDEIDSLVASGAYDE
jgi:predicted small metal-binding protein